MQTKLTLYLDEQLIERATLYAQERGKTLSQVVSDYLALLAVSTEQNSERDSELPPITESLIGILRDSNASEHDYHEYLETKYR